MQRKQIRMTIVTEQGETGAIDFEGIPLGRSFDMPVDIDKYKTTVEIYQIDGGIFVVYVSYRDKDGETSLAKSVETKSLDLGAVRSALKQARIYPGPMYSEAIYHSFDTLELLK